MNNLIVVSIEKFSSTRDVPKSFSVATVRKLVYGAWIIGCLSLSAPAATMSVVRSNINGTHYTVDCKIDKSNLTYRAIEQGFGLIQFFIPSIILLCINLIIARRVWKRQSRRINIQRNNAIRWKSDRLKSEEHIFSFSLLLFPSFPIHFLLVSQST